jgi:hypothetical protein
MPNKDNPAEKKAPKGLGSRWEIALRIVSGVVAALGPKLVNRFGPRAFAAIVHVTTAVLAFHLTYSGK